MHIFDFFKKNRSRRRIAGVLCLATAVTLVLPSTVGIGGSSPAEAANTVIDLKLKSAATTIIKGEEPDGLYPEETFFGSATVNDHRTPAYKKCSEPALYTKSASASDPYKDDFADYLGETMVTQLTNTFNNSAGPQATVTAMSPSVFANRNPRVNDINSSITFTIPTSALPKRNMTSADILPYLDQAISRFPRLCCLFTFVYLDILDTQATLTVYSPIKKDELYSTTLAYETALDDILKVPLTNQGMNNIEKLLYLHDEVAAMSEYSYRSDLYAIDHIPVGAMIYGLGVCQSYACVFNHAARKLGITSYMVCSTTHAWNAIQLNNLWYYLDATWDDTSASGKDKVSHQLFLVNNDKFTSGHDLDPDYYAEHFSGITSSMGTTYDNYFPRQKNILTQMGYTGGYFYFTDSDSKMFRWSGAGNAVRIDTVSNVLYRRTAVCNNTVYISGTDGIYECDSALTKATKISNLSYSGMYEAICKLYVTQGGSWFIYKDYSSAVATPTPTPTGSFVTPTPSGSASFTPNISASASPTPTISGPNIPTVPPSATSSASPTPTPTSSATPTKTPTIKTPGQTTIKSAKNVKTLSAKVVWKKVSGTSRYRIQYSTKSKFTDKKFRDVLINSVTINNLSKNKTYYFRVRAVKIRSIDGTLYYKYGKWSSKKKVKIKK